MFGWGGFWTLGRMDAKVPVSYLSGRRVGYIGSVEFVKISMLLFTLNLGLQSRYFECTERVHRSTSSSEALKW